MNDYSLIFSQNETLKSINKDIVITITPPKNILKYEYTVFKENQVVTKETVVNNPIDILLNSSGNYKIEVTLYDERLNKINVNSGIYKIDKEKPIIKVSNDNIKIKKNENFDIKVEAYDEIDGDLSSKVTSNYRKLDFNEVGEKKLIYTVSDDAGNQTIKQVNINVYKDSKSLIFFASIITLCFIFLLGLIIRYLRSSKLEKRITKYSIEPVSSDGLSILDKIFKKYLKFVSIIGKYLEKSVFLKKYGQKYDKYIGSINKHYKKGIDIVVSKICISILFVLLAVFSKTIQGKTLQIYETLLPLLVGFFLLDIIYFSKYKVYRLKLENDLLQAIIIMNNAFKSGRSITQAIELVSKELDGPISLEFKKMTLEISFGLSIEEVFRRFSKRVNLEEVTYLTASLSILNKTGGNIIKVFTSIEKNLFSKKKLNLELKSLTGSSRIIVYVLFIVPILFVLFISIIDPSYFIPLIKSPIGLCLTGVIIFFYIIYIFVIRKVMKVRM